MQVSDLSFIKKTRIYLRLFVVKQFWPFRIQPSQVVNPDIFLMKTEQLSSSPDSSRPVYPCFRPTLNLKYYYSQEKRKKNKKNTALMNILESYPIHKKP